jgi:hypothetical protein
MQTGVQIAGSASSPPILTKGVVAVPEPLTSEILTQTVLQVQEGGLPVLNHQDAWRVTPDLMAAMERLMAIVSWVRSPAGGWSKERVVDAETLLPYVMDEALDVLDSLEKSWMYLGLPASHPFAPLQKLLNDRLILSDAISQLLWGVARSSVETMQLLGGIPAELFQAGKEWTPGILRLMAILTIQTPNFQWQMDLVTAAPPLPELHSDSLLRWFNSRVFWAEGLLQTLQETIAHNTLPLQNLLTQAVPSDIIAPSQPWQKGTLHLSLGFTFAPHATKPVLSVLPSTLAVAEPPKPDWTEYDFSDLTPAPQGIASIPTLPLEPEERDGVNHGGTSESRTEFAPELTPEIQPTFTETPQQSPAVQQFQVAQQPDPSFHESPPAEGDTEALFDEDWVSGVGAPSPEMALEPIEESPAPQEIEVPEDEDNDLFGEYFREPVAPPVGQSPVEHSIESPLDEAEIAEEGEDLFNHWGEFPADSSGGSLPQGIDDRSEDIGLDTIAIDALETESLGTNSQPDFEIVLDGALLQPSVPMGGYGQNGASFKVNSWDADLSDQRDQSVQANNAEVVVDETENWNLEQWRIRWCAEHTDVESDRLQLPRSYHVKNLLHRLGTTGKITQPSLNKEHHLVEIIDLACEALKLPDPPPTLLNTNFVPSESSLATLVNRLTWELIRNSYGITCLLSGIPAQILQPEWGWESGVLRLLPILKVQSLNEPEQGMESAAIDLQVDLGTGAPAPLETILLLPDILVSIDGSDWQQTRESVIEFRSGILKQIYQLLPELEVLCCPVPVELAIDQDLWQPATVHLQLELGFQGN